DSLLFVDNRGANFNNRATLVLLDAGTAVQEVRRIGEMSEVSISSVAQEAYDAGSLVRVVTLGDASTVAITAGVAAGATADPVSDMRPLHVGEQVLVGSPGSYERHVVATVTPGGVAPNGNITTVAPLAAPKGAADHVVERRSLTVDARAGLTFLALDDRSGL